jgi:hypothetical protein
MTWWPSTLGSVRRSFNPYPVIEPVWFDGNWKLQIDEGASPKAISRSLLRLALEQSERGSNSLSDELLELASIWEAKS